MASDRFAEEKDDAISVAVTAQGKRGIILMARLAREEEG
jgi:hypothetical protein